MPIPVLITARTPQPILTPRRRTFVRIKRCNKAIIGNFLPTILNLNPRSVYNKVIEFHVLLKELGIDLICMSESWERDNLTLSKLLDLPGYKIISRPGQRPKGKTGGRPAIIASEQHFHVKPLIPDPIPIPDKIEIVWGLLTPKYKLGPIKHIAVASIYSKPHAVTKTLLINHITEVYMMLRAKYPTGLHFLLAGDTNDLKLEQILNLSKNFQQLVKVPTRLNPERILDPIITDLGSYYKAPVTRRPLDPDPDKNGKPSDHLMVIMQPITDANTFPGRKSKVINTRPLPPENVTNFENSINQIDWTELYDEKSATKKVEIFENEINTNIDLHLPLKQLKITDDDQPWVTNEIKSLKRKKTREYWKNGRSDKWLQLKTKYDSECAKEKGQFYSKFVEDLKTSNPSQWYSKLKRLCAYDQVRFEPFDVEELQDVPDPVAANLIADQFAKVSQQFPPVNTEALPAHQPSRPHPTIFPHQVKDQILKAKKTKGTLEGDIPIKLCKLVSTQVSEPLANIYNSAITNGEYPTQWKHELVNPIPKIFPPQMINDLRKISGTKFFSKIFERILSEWILDDMDDTLDTAHYGGFPGRSTAHYLISLIDKTTSILDDSDFQFQKVAVILEMFDWSKAFDMQCNTQAITSLVQNNVRNCLIPVLTSYVSGRTMTVKWKGTKSTPRDLPGGGAQGTIIGPITYFSQSNDSASCVPSDERFKFVDDLTILEKVIITNKITSYNFRRHVPSDIADHGNYIHSDLLLTQKYTDEISEWTKQKLMKLNEQKTKCMTINFTKNHQFSTRITLNDQPLEFIDNTKLLGLTIQNDLKWDMHVSEMTSKAYSRFSLLTKLIKFNIPQKDLVTIYCLYIRSVLEFNCVVFHSTLTVEQSDTIERVQRTALRVIIGEYDIDYPQTLTDLNLVTLYERRTLLCLNFAKKCTTSTKNKHLFPLNSPPKHPTRHSEKYKVPFARTNRYRDSSLPYMARLLNQNDQKNTEVSIVN